MAIRKGSDYELSGEAPWVTGAKHADLLVTGATLDNGEQFLAAIPTDRAGSHRLATPLKLLAAERIADGFRDAAPMSDVRADEILIGPCPQVMKVGVTGGTGSLTTTAVAIGAAASEVLGGIGTRKGSGDPESLTRLSDADCPILHERIQGPTGPLASGCRNPGVAELELKTIAGRSASLYRRIPWQPVRHRRWSPVPRERATSAANPPNVPFARRCSSRSGRVHRCCRFPQDIAGIDGDQGSRILMI